MKLFGNRSESAEDPRETQSGGDVLASFRQRIQEKRDLLYGIALFFEGLSSLYAGRQEIIDSYRERFRDLIGHGTDMLDRAEDLLELARHDPARRPELERFDFDFMKDYPDAGTLADRARILVETYEDLFADRPRDKPFSDREKLRLMETAAQRL